MFRVLIFIICFSFGNLSWGQEQDINRNFSLGLHGLESLLGNYGMTLSIKLTPYVSLTVPIEYYSFEHSLPGSIAIRSASTIAQSQGILQIPDLSMIHLRSGLGIRIFTSPNTMSSGLYFEPIIYLGWIRNSDFSAVEFDDQGEVMDAVVNALNTNLPKKDHFALSPQLNIGYQWVFNSGIMLQFASYGNYVFAPRVDSIFAASDRFFTSRAIGSRLKSVMPRNSFDLFRALGTQMNGWHAGIALNMGLVF